MAVYEAGITSESPRKVPLPRPNEDVAVPCQLVPFHEKTLPRVALVVVPVPPFAIPTVPRERVPALNESGPETVTDASCFEPFA